MCSYLMQHKATFEICCNRIIALNMAIICLGYWELRPLKGVTLDKH